MSGSSRIVHRWTADQVRPAAWLGSSGGDPPAAQRCRGRPSVDDGEIMGFFTKDVSGTPQQLLEPLSRDRIKTVLDARGLNYGVDDDGDVGGYWDGHLFYFFVLGQSDEYLQVRSRWNRQVGAQEQAALQDAVNAWNADRLWPKAYVRVEDGVPAVYAEHTVDYEHGVTDQQIDLHLMCAISTSLKLYEQLDEAYPAAAAQAQAELAAAQAEQDER